GKARRFIGDDYIDSNRSAFQSMRKRKTKDIATCCDGDMLNPVDHVGHRRSMHRLAGVEMPQWTTSLRIHGFEGTGVIAEEDKPPGGRQRSSPGIAGANLGITPHYLPVSHRVRQQHLLSTFIGRKFRAGIVVSLPHCERLWVGEEQIAAFQSDHVE